MAGGKRQLIEDCDTIREFVAVSFIDGKKIDKDFVEATKLSLQTKDGQAKFNTIVKGLNNLMKSDVKVVAKVLESVYGITMKDRPPQARADRAMGDAVTIIQEQSLPYDLASKQWKVEELSETINNLKNQVIDRDQKIEILTGKIKEQTREIDTLQQTVSKQEKQINNLEVEIMKGQGMSSIEIDQIKNKGLAETASQSQGRKM